MELIAIPSKEGIKQYLKFNYTDVLTPKDLYAHHELQ